MKKFKFNLESVLKYREMLQKLQERRLGEAGRALALAREELAQMRSALEKSYIAAQPMQTVDVTAVVLSEQYRERLTIEIDQKRAAVAQLQLKFNEERMALTKAVQAKEVIVKLKEKAWSDYRQEAEKEQQAVVDELIVLRYESESPPQRKS